MISYAPLWKTMQQKSISSYYLRNKGGNIKINNATIKRLKTGQSVSTNTLDSLCKLLKCDLSDIIEFIDE